MALNSKKGSSIPVPEAKAWLLSHDLSAENTELIIKFLDKENTGYVRSDIPVKFECLTMLRCRNSYLNSCFTKVRKNAKK